MKLSDLLFSLISHGFIVNFKPHKTACIIQVQGRGKSYVHMFFMLSIDCSQDKDLAWGEQLGLVYDSLKKEFNLHEPKEL